jgi:hypothetical protein
VYFIFSTSLILFFSALRSALADLVHIVRAELKTPQLSRVVFLFARNIHDPSLPLQIQVCSLANRSICVGPCTSYIFFSNYCRTHRPKCYSTLWKSSSAKKMTAMGFLTRHSSVFSIASPASFQHSRFTTNSLIGQLESKSLTPFVHVLPGFVEIAG